jgi:hypothetical protein
MGPVLCRDGRHLKPKTGKHTSGSIEVVLRRHQSDSLRASRTIWAQALSGENRIFHCAHRAVLNDHRVGGNTGVAREIGHHSGLTDIRLYSATGKYDVVGDPLVPKLDCPLEPRFEFWMQLPI